LAVLGHLLNQIVSCNVRILEGVRQQASETAIVDQVEDKVNDKDSRRSTERQRLKAEITQP